MQETVLSAPADSELARLFLRHFRLSADRPPQELLRAVAAAFTRLPYENLTKIIKQDQPFEWTFPDFRDGRYDHELSQIRKTYLDQLRQWRTAGG